MSVAWFDGVTLTVEIAFTTDPLDPAPSWTDVTDDVRGFSMSSGRSSEFSSISPSTLSITLNNRERQYDPEYASSPYVGNLLPMKKIRVRATYSATTYDLFTGYVQGWPQQYVFHFDSTVTINAVDGSRFLEQAVLAKSAYEAEVTADAPSHYWPMQENNTSSASAYVDIADDRDLYMDATGSLASVDLAVPMGQTSAPQATVANSSILATVTSSGHLAVEPRTIEFWYRKGVPADLVTYSDTTPSLVVTFDGGTYLSVSHNNGFLLSSFSSASINMKLISVASATAPATGQISHLAVTVSDTTLTMYVNGESVYSGALVATAGTISVEGVFLSLVVNADAPEAISHIAVYPTALSADRIAEHYEAGVIAFGAPSADLSGERFERVLDDADWPATFRAVSDGVSLQGPYRPDGMSAMQYLRDVETSEDGLFFIDGSGDVAFRDRQWLWTSPIAATFSDDGSDIAYSSITIDANTVDVIRNKVSGTFGVGDSYLFVEDTASRDAYGPSIEALSLPTIDDPDLVRSLVAYKLRTMKDPKSRITSITVKPRSNAATAFPAVLGLELGDRVRVEITPLDLGSQVAKSLYVQGVNHSVSVDGEWATTLYLSPALAAEDVPYLTLGDATYGRIGAAAGNQVPF